ncbi:PTS transporter subunit EIIC [Nesterenkonia sp. PF2B19]|uniref:PTS transporter subunit EIIC n=1 Tax=Nesterenkonia sp. PF2B19 TaxID=1881858 RepID=UPI000A19F8CD|nr:PTS transporter subunit EIIC [Nesterenkonia sp. PF2B19]OSM44341.1 hypothetical protein BCY76_003195 [Nesterenkonia sp. PF2B19]
MSTQDPRALAEDILDGVGGAANVTSSAHCATRVRVVLRDESAVRAETLRALPGVITVIRAHGELHVVTGEGAELVHQELELLTRRPAGPMPELELSTAVLSVRGLGSRIVTMLAAVFTPVIWPLAAAGLLKTVVVVLGELGWLNPEAGTFTVLSAVSEGIFLFLPLFLAVTAARRFGAQPFTAMAVAAALVYPSILDLGEAQSHTAAPTGSLLGVPFPIMVFAASVIPILLVVFVQAWVERTLDRMLPAAVRSVGTPLVTLLLVVTGALVLLGPMVVITGEALVALVVGVLESTPWLAGAVLGGLWHVLTILGLQWGMLGTIAESVGTGIAGVPTAATLPAVIAAAVVAQAGAAGAVLLRTRSAARRKIAGPPRWRAWWAGLRADDLRGHPSAEEAVPVRHARRRGRRCAHGGLRGGRRERSPARAGRCARNDGPRVSSAAAGRAGAGSGGRIRAHPAAGGPGGTRRGPRRRTRPRTADHHLDVAGGDADALRGGAAGRAGRHAVDGGGHGPVARAAAPTGRDGR